MNLEGIMPSKVKSDKERQTYIITYAEPKNMKQINQYNQIEKKKKN